MVCVDINHGAVTRHWVSNFVVPQLIIRPVFIEVTRVALVRPLPVSSQCDLTITAAEDLNDPARKRLDAGTRD